MSKLREAGSKVVNNQYPTVSVLILAYNHVNYIRDTIEGALKQKGGFHLEIVIGEDSSTDATADIVDYYHTKYPNIIKIVTSEFNVGMMNNLVRTLNACTGQYIAFCEGDDYWTDPNKLQMQVDVLESDDSIALVHTDCDFLYCNSFKIVQAVNKSGNCDYINFKNPFLGILKGHYSINTLTVLVRTAILRNDIAKGILDTQRRQIDLLLWLSITQKHPISYIDKSTSVYRILEESASKSKNKVKQLDFLIDSKLTRLEHAKKYTSDSELIEFISDSYNLLRIRKAYHLADPKRAKKAYSQLNSRPPLREFLQYLCLTNRYVSILLVIPGIARKWFLKLLAR